MEFEGFGVPSVPSLWGPSLWCTPGPSLWGPLGPQSLESSVFEVPPGSLVFGVLSLQGSPGLDLWGSPWVSAIWLSLDPQSLGSPDPSLWSTLRPWSLGSHQVPSLLVPQVPSLAFGSPSSLVFKSPGPFLCVPDLQVPFPGPRPWCSVPFLIINPNPGPDLGSLVMGPIPWSLGPCLSPLSPFPALESRSWSQSLVLLPSTGIPDLHAPLPDPSPTSTLLHLWGLPSHPTALTPSPTPQHRSFFSPVCSKLKTCHHTPIMMGGGNPTSGAVTSPGFLPPQTPLAPQPTWPRCHVEPRAASGGAVLSAVLTSLRFYLFLLLSSSSFCRSPIVAYFLRGGESGEGREYLYFSLRGSSLRHQGGSSCPITWALSCCHPWL